VRRWFVAYTQPQSETKAAFHLRRQGFEVYLPQYQRLRRHARRRDFVNAPLFPRYLFVAFDLERDRWRAARSTVGVADMICNGDRPVVVPEQIVAQIRARENDKGQIILGKLTPFNAGEKVQILIGAFADCLGIFQCQTDVERVRVLLDLLGRKVAVELPLEAVAAPA
jgi:transcriptional antiterminator RfaH